MNTERLVGIDVARGCALIGMFVAHAAPRADEGEWVVDGRSALLFGTLAGASLGLMSGAASPIPDRGRMRRSVLLRAVFLIALGLILWLIPTNIAIILDYYGVMFLLLAPLLFLRRVLLAALALLLFVAAPLLAELAEPLVGSSSTGWPLAILIDRLLTGYYPALVWLPVLIVGLIAARSDLSAPLVQFILVLGGTAAMVIGYGAAASVPGVSAEAHSSTHAEILGSGGFAFTVIGVILLATRPRSDGAPRMFARLARPIEAMGAMPLTVYTAQIMVIAGFFVAAGKASGLDYENWWLVAGLIIGSAAFALAWRRVRGRGPLESAIRGFSMTQ